MGLIIEKAKKNGFSFSLSGKQLSSKYDPIKEGKRLVENIQPRLYKAATTSESPIVVTLGFFPIYHIYHILQEFPNAKLLVFDNELIPKSDLKKAWGLVAGEHQKSASFNLLHFYPELKDLLADVSKYSKDQLESLVTLPSPYIDTELSVKFQKHYLQTFRRKVSEAKTVSHFNYIWDVHTLQNLKHLDKYEGKLIQNLFFNLEDVHFNNKETIKKPALFISSGPLLDDYLDKHIKDLVSISHVIPVICVPAMAKRLLQLGVNITAIFTSDAGFPNSYHFMHLYKQTTKIPIVTPLSVHPNILRNSGKVFCYCDLEIKDTEIYNALGKSNFISPDASVVLSAIRFLVHMGFKNIYTLGVNFAMYPFKEHAISNTSEEIWFNKNTHWSNYSTLTHKTYHLNPNLNSVKASLDKDNLTSNSVLEIYKHEYEKLTSVLKKNDVLVHRAQDIPKINPFFIKNNENPKAFLDHTKTPRNYQQMALLLKSYLEKKYFNLTGVKNTLRSPQQNWLIERLKKS